jgi:hypothetical protein
MVAAAIFGGAAISGGSSLLGGLIGSGGAQAAASTNAKAEQQAVQASLTEQQNAFGAAQFAWQQAQDNASNYYTAGANIGQSEDALGQQLISNYGDLSRAGINNYYQQAYDALNPYVSRGTQVGDQLVGELQSGALGAMPSLTDLSQLPGYQFTLDQGLKATQNAAAAQGLGVSGAAMKGATNYAEGTANTFANQYLNNYWANQNNRYNMLAGVMNTGATAAANLGSAANIAGSNFGTSATTTGGQAGTLQSQVAQLIAGGAFNTGNQLTTTAGQLGSAAAGGATQAGGQQASAFTQGGANVGATQQSAANLQAAGLTGAGSAVNNALLNNFLLNPSANSGAAGSGGSTIYLPGTSTPLNTYGSPVYYG